jgi:hypothetical protein
MRARNGGNNFARRDDRHDLVVPLPILRRRSRPLQLRSGRQLSPHDSRLVSFLRALLVASLCCVPLRRTIFFENSAACNTTARIIYCVFLLVVHKHLPIRNAARDN